MAGASTPNSGQACDACLARSWLLVRVAGHLECVRDRIEPLLLLGDAQLIEAIGGERRTVLAGELERFDPGEARKGVTAAGLTAICRCDPRYPPRLASLPRPPATIHVAGSLQRFLELASQDPVAIVGSRRASDYGLEVARSLGRGLGAAGVTVVSGMAFGVDSAAHAGALAAGAATIAVLPGPADRPYPASRRSLHRQIRDTGAAISELPPGSAVWRWMFPARNRIIAALSALTVVVEAGERSGALLTAAVASQLGRGVGAVPGRVTSPLAAGPNRLLAAGAQLVRGPQDVLDHLFGAGARVAGPGDRRPSLEPRLRSLLDAIATGADTPLALSRAGLSAAEGLAALASLEIAGYVQRGAGGRFVAMP
jgi:DNA processing protein